jgi:hypothetical protein
MMPAGINLLVFFVLPVF